MHDRTPMLVLRHRLTPRSIGAAFGQQEIRSDDLVICRAQFHGGMFDEVANLPSGRRGAWSKVRFILRGRVLTRSRAGDAVLGPGDFVTSVGWDDYWCQALDPTTEYLLVGWKHGGCVGDRPRREGPMYRSRLGARNPEARAFDLADALDQPDDARVLRATTLLMTSLADFGYPVARDAATAASRTITMADRRFAHAMESSIFPLTSRPMAIDLGAALGIGDRHAMRLAKRFFQRFFVTASGWREYVRGMRLELGVFLASNAGATTEEVSRALGFASPTALCHAFHSVGMPSPHEVRRRLARGEPRRR